MPLLLYILGSLLASAITMGLLLFMTAYFSLPVRSFRDGRRAAWRLLNSVIGGANTVAFIKEGQLAFPGTGEKDRQPSLALVGLKSAAVLGHSTEAASGKKSKKSRRPVRKAKPGKSRLRVVKPGLVFIESHEMFRGVASLRKQVRVAPDIECPTSDGIELSTSVWVMFSLIHPPEVLFVTYADRRPDDLLATHAGRRPDDLYVVKIDSHTRRITAISDELDARDKAEIHLYQRTAVAENQELYQPGTFHEYPPVPINAAVEKRIAAALYYRPQNIDEQHLDDWLDIPLEESVRIFRNLITMQRFDDLFHTPRTMDFPLQERIKPRFTEMVRNQGVLSYQLIRPLDGVKIRVGQVVDSSNWRIYPVQEFTSRTILRERGIKVLAAGFAELVPNNPNVMQQRLENWQAYWERAAEINRANQEMEIMRIRRRARADAQREMVLNLSQILQSSPHSEEALAMRIFQALEAAAADPATHQLLPRDTIIMLRSLRQWLLPEDQAPAGVYDDIIDA